MALSLRRGKRLQSDPMLLENFAFSNFCQWQIVLFCLHMETDL